MATVRIVKWGNSLAVRIPKVAAEEAGVNEGDPLELQAECGEIKLRRRDRVPTLKELVSRITPENRHGEMLVGLEVGKEVVEW
jgi:antitoxin MazE